MQKNYQKKIEFYKKSIEEDKAYLDELEQDDEDDVYEYACDELRNDELLLRKAQYEYAHRNDLDVLFNSLWIIKKYKKIKKEIWLKKHRLTMFDNCKSFASFGLSNWEPSNVTDMGNMFDNCKLLDLKDLSDLKKFKI